MTNNNNVDKSCFVKHAATGVAFALAPFAIAFGISSVVAPSAEAASCRYEFAGAQIVQVCNSGGFYWVQ